jgi:dienelactone hydrolase
VRVESSRRAARTSWSISSSHPTTPDYIRYVCEPGGSGLRSPLYAASKIETPVLLIHGDRDTRVPTEQSLKMKEALLKANRQVELQIIPGAEHAFTEEQYQRAWPLTVGFFATHLERR